MYALSVSHLVNLNFDTLDDEGLFVTAESALKHKCLSSISTEAVTAAAGKMNSVHGVLGMASAGKTLALRELASEK